MLDGGPVALLMWLQATAPPVDELQAAAGREGGGNSTLPWVSSNPKAPDGSAILTMAETGRAAGTLT